MGNMMKKIVLFAVLAASAPTAAWADNKKAETRDDQMVCKSIRETGSRLSKVRVCQTREQWNEQRRIQRADLDRAQSRKLEPTNQ